MMSEVELITVEVAYALPYQQKIIALQVAPGTTAMAAVERSGIAKMFPEIELPSVKMGIFGQALGTKGLGLPQDHILHSGDRVEIYRPLICDPKDARRRRAEKSNGSDA